MQSVVLSHRRLLVVLAHATLAVAANYLAFVVRFEGAIPGDAVRLWASTVPLIVALRLLAFIPLRLDEGLWRYASVWDLRNIIVGVALSSSVFAATIYGVGVSGYPRSVFVIDTLLLVFFMGGVRLARRFARELTPNEQRRKILIVGAGDAGEMIVRDMKHNPNHGYEPVGFADDDPKKIGQRIHGVPVLGPIGDLPTILVRAKPEQVLVAIPSADNRTIRAIITSLQRFKIPIKTLPSISELLECRVVVTQIRDLAVEDLLPRPPVDVDRSSLEQLIAGKRVLVTGAGGSIGSELCRQITVLNPASLVLVERYENALFAIAGELCQGTNKDRVHPVIADVCDLARVAKVFGQHAPQIVFHAAAHKHVPMMELNPAEAVKNNILGTRCVARASDRFDVERFVMISTDKAVNPTSVMGVTKRVAEFVVQEIGSRSATRFVTVRFGNVLGSNGSVVPVFLEQIKAGGPVTVTHPDVRRFFMLISEAVTLVMQAAAHAAGGEIFVLEMGEQIRVVDMARNLIRMSGFVPGDEIPIAYIGLRPGEKLFEELVGTDETVEPSPVDKTRRVRPKAFPDNLDACLVRLGRAAAREEIPLMIQHLKELVPTYEPQGGVRRHSPPGGPIGSE